MTFRWRFDPACDRDGGMVPGISVAMRNNPIIPVVRETYPGSLSIAILPICQGVLMLVNLSRILLHGEENKP